MKKTYLNNDEEGCSGCGGCSDKESDAVNPVKYLFREKRTIYFSNPVMPGPADLAFVQLMELEDRDPGKPITLIVDSLGGFMDDGLKLYDLMQEIISPVHTVCYGSAASMGALLLSAGEPGHRYISPSARTMLHTPKTGPMQQGMDPHQMEILQKQFKRFYEITIDIMAHHTGQDRKKIEKDVDRTDLWMGAQETVEYGLADHVKVHTSGIHSVDSPVRSVLRTPARKVGGLLSKARRVGGNLVGVLGKALKDGQ